MPKISIIIPVFNVENYMDKCFDSLYLQTLKEIEIICINDCSTDNSLKKLLNYQLRDSRIKIIDLKKNKGAAYARNQGLKIANGEYLGFVDPDDSVDTDFYEKLYKEAKNGNYDIVKAERKTYELNGVINISKLNKKVNKDKFEFSCEWTTAIYKHNLIKKNKIKFLEYCKKNEDTLFLFENIIHTNSLKTIHGIYYNYYRRHNSLNYYKQPISNIKSALASIEIIIKKLNTIKVTSRQYKFIFLKYFNELKILLKQNNSIEAIELFVKYMVIYYKICKNKNILLNYYNNEFIQLLKQKSKEQLKSYLINTSNALNKKDSILEKIFYIKNDTNKKVINIVGFKIKINKSKKE